MSDRNPEYDFKWCPGCGDFGVKRALEQALGTYTEEFEIPRTSNVIIAGIGCSGNMVHMLDGEQPFGIHGIHGRTLPIAFGVATSRPELNTIVVAGDGDFLCLVKRLIELKKLEYVITPNSKYSKFLRPYRKEYIKEIKMNLKKKLERKKKK